MVRFVLLTALLVCGAVIAREEAAYVEERDYYGEDITRPLNRFDLRAEGQKGENCRHSSDVIATARTDLLIKLPDGWSTGVRVDVPYAWYWSGSRQSACGHDVFHLDDSLLQVILIAPECGKWTGAFGVKAIFPTAGDHLEIGDGKYQLLPSAGFKYDLGEWSQGAYAGLIVRQAFDVAGYRSAPYICKTYIEPFLNINLPDQWFINFSPEIIYNWRIRKWFVPFDMMVGTMVSENVIVSLEYESAIVYGYKQFTQSLEFRVGYFY